MKKLIPALILICFVCFVMPVFAECPEGYRVCGRTPTGGVVCCRNHMGGVQGAIDIDKNILISQYAGEQNGNTDAKGIETESIRGELVYPEETDCLIAQNCTNGGYRCSPGITRCCSPFTCRALGKGAAQGPYVCQ